MPPNHWDCDQAFSAAECAAILELAEAVPMAPAPVWTGRSYEVVPAARRAALAHHERAAGTEWIFARLDRLFGEAGARLGIAVGPVREPIQMLRYDVGGHFQGWHSDAGADLVEARRISASVELSDAADYEGGDLELLGGLSGRTRPPARGAARFFPSAAIHRVTPVTRGIRRAMVVWTG